MASNITSEQEQEYKPQDCVTTQSIIEQTNDYMEERVRLAEIKRVLKSQFKDITYVTERIKQLDRNLEKLDAMMYVPLKPLCSCDDCKIFLQRQVSFNYYLSLRMPICGSVFLNVILRSYHFFF